MKTNRNWMIVGGLLAGSLIWAQETPAPVSPSAAMANTPPANLAENVVLHFQGAYSGSSVDVTIVVGTSETPTPGGFATFVLPKGDVSLILQLQGDIKTVAGGYQVHFTVGGSFPLKTSVSGGKSTTYRAAKTELTVLLKPGQPAVVSDSPECTMTVTANKMPESGKGTTLTAKATGARFDDNFRVEVKVTGANAKTENYALVTAGGGVTLSMVRDRVEVNGIKTPIIGTMSADVASVAPGELAVRFNLGESMPLVIAAQSGGATNVSYHNVSENTSVFFKKLDVPITLFQGAFETVTLTLSLARQP